jgi:DNA-binding NarL/FixJ family response regulator
LQARVALRLRRPEDTVDLLARWRSTGDRRKDAERNILLASAYERLGRYAPAAALYEEPFPRNAGPALENERIYLRALGHWQRQEYDESERLIGRQQPGDGASLGLGCDLLGWIAFSRGDYPAAARHFENALDAFGAMRTPDEGARVASMVGIAIIALETLELSLHERLVAEYERTPRTPGTKKRLFRIGQYLVLLAAVSGNDESAFTIATALQNQAEHHVERVFAHVTLAEFLRVRGDRVGPKLHLELAAEALRSERWSRGNADDAMAALLYAVEASYHDPHAAAEALTRVLSASGKADMMLTFEHDPRATALALYARGRVALALADPLVGEDLIRRAREIWSEHAYRYRVSIVDLDLAEAFEDRAAIENAHAILEDIPDSWLVRRAERIQKRLGSGLPDLSPAERRVLRELCAGKSNREIATALQRSESTIRNQTQRIFDVLGVNSRAALVARCGELTF